MIAIAWMLSWAWAGTQPYKAPLPILDRAALAHVQTLSATWHSCQLIAVVDQHGYVVTTILEDCPEPLQAETMNTLQRWDFYPPTEGGLARSEDVLVDFRFISGVVVTDPPPGDDRPRVRLPPAAIPLWPLPPRLTGDLKRATRAAGEEGVLCAMTLAIDGRGMPDDLEILSCPEEVAAIAVKRLSRYGVGLLEAEPGDGTRYLYEVWLPASRSRQRD